MATIYRHWFPCTVTPENPHGKGYVGRTYRTLEERDRERFAPSSVKDSVGLKRAIVKYGKENMQTDIIEGNILPINEVVDEREKHWIAHFDDYHNGYNQTKGGDGFDPETAREINRKRVADGTHHFLGENNPVHKRVADGTHNLLGGEIQRENNRKRLDDGTHNFLGGEIQRKRLDDGTHNLLGGEIQRETNRKRLDDGTHNFLGGEIQRETNRKRLDDGTHNFLGGETNRKRLDDGTHHFLGGENNRKRVEDGTHNLLGENRCPEFEKKRIKAHRNTCARKRHKVYWYYIIALSRYWYETHAYSIQYREAFDNQEIPDTSDAKQLQLF